MNMVLTLQPTDIDIPKLEKEYYDGEFSAEFRRAQLANDRAR